jgi:hypothetical protein
MLACFPNQLLKTVSSFACRRVSCTAIADDSLLLPVDCATVQYKRGRANSSSTALHAISLPSSDYWSVNSDVHLPWDAFLRGPFGGDTSSSSSTPTETQRKSITSSSSSATTTARNAAAVPDAQRQQQQQQLAAASIR